jgi:hypothetical protein
MNRAQAAFAQAADSGAGFAQTVQHRGAFTLIAGQRQNTDIRIVPRQRLQRFQRAIGAAVHDHPNRAPDASVGLTPML